MLFSDDIILIDELVLGQAEIFCCYEHPVNEFWVKQNFK